MPDNLATHTIHGKFAAGAYQYARMEETQHAKLVSSLELPDSIAVSYRLGRSSESRQCFASQLALVATVQSRKLTLTAGGLPFCQQSPKAQILGFEYVSTRIGVVYTAAT